MQKIPLLIISLFLALSLNAQQFSLEYGKVMSSFDYTNSDGNKLDNLQGTTDNHIGIGFKMPIRKSSFYFLSGIEYNKYGAEGSDDILGNYYDWKLNYIAVNLGVGYEFFKGNSFLNIKNSNTEQGFTFFIQIDVAPEFFVQGTQTINNDVYNLKGVEQFDKPFLSTNGGVGVIYYASKTVSVYAQYMGGMSFSVFKSDADTQEELNFITHTISLGFSINLPVRR